MTDVALRWITDEARADAVVTAEDLLADDGLQSAVLLSLMCDRRADDNDVLPPGETERRGWWADQFSGIEGDRIGSKLWLLKRERRTRQTLLRARQYSLDSLQWMIDDKIVARIECQTGYSTVAKLTNANVGIKEYALVIVVKLFKLTGGSDLFSYTLSLEGGNGNTEDFGDSTYIATDPDTVLATDGGDLFII
jgi:phage gp46-like protein